MRLIPVMGLVLACAACAAQGAAASYGLGAGTADYETLKTESAKCAGLGGSLKPKGQGSAKMLSNYYCDIEKRK